VLYNTATFWYERFVTALSQITKVETSLHDTKVDLDLAEKNIAKLTLLVEGNQPLLSSLHDDYNDLEIRNSVLRLELRDKDEEINKLQEVNANPNSQRNLRNTLNLLDKANYKLKIAEAFHRETISKYQQSEKDFKWRIDALTEAYQVWEEKHKKLKDLLKSIGIKLDVEELKAILLDD